LFIDYSLVVYEPSGNNPWTESNITGSNLILIPSSFGHSFVSFVWIFFLQHLYDQKDRLWKSLKDDATFENTLSQEGKVFPRLLWTAGM
jgi:hypothetical protein